MKKALTVLLLLASAASAAPPDWDDFQSQIVTTFQDVLCIIYKVMWAIAGPLAVLVLVWAGVKWVYARDNPSEREAAKEMVTYAIIALILLLISKAIPEFILSKPSAPIVFNCV